jgi:hypothetical protein
MMRDEAEHRRLSDLASSAIDGCLTPAQREQLEHHLRTSEPARAYYVRYMGLSAELAWAARGQTAVTTPVLRRVWRQGWYPLAAASLLLVAMLGAWVFWQRPGGEPHSAPGVQGVAFLSTAVNLEWEGSQEPLHVDDLLKPGWMRVKSGLTQIQFVSGASVWLEGPAAMKLNSTMEGYVESGKVVAVVPKGSSGLHVDTPLGSVTDRGTGFGMEVSQTQVAVHVFEGAVQVTPNGGQPMTYVGGQMVVLRADGGTRLGMADPRAFDYMGYGWSDGFMYWDWGPPHHGRWPGWAGPGWPGSYWPAAYWPSAAWPAPAWKGGNPLDYIRAQMRADEARWTVLEPKIGAYLDAQRVARGEGFPLDNDVTRTLWALELAVLNPDATEDELSKDLAELRAARQVARHKLEAAEKALMGVLTVTEEARLVTLGCLKSP